MRKAKITATFKADIKTIWYIMTDNSNYAWRSDLSKIEIFDNGSTFVEHTKTGHKTTFKITLKKPYERYEFDMRGNQFNGHWVGMLTRTDSNETRIELTENIKFASPIMQMISYFAMPLKKSQKTYIDDLRKALGEQETIK